MNVLIDGHNLIGQMPGISLDDPNDEAKLVLHLRRYATVNRRRSVIVVFDRGSYGHPQHLDGYGVQCFFTHSPRDADAEIIRRIAAITRPTDWRVVTSDRQIIRAADERRIKVIRSADFARELLAVGQSARKIEAEPQRERRLSPKEINEWLVLFGEAPEPLPESTPRPAPNAEKQDSVSWKRRGKRTRKK